MTFHRSEHTDSVTELESTLLPTSLIACLLTALSLWLVLLAFPVSAKQDNGQSPLYFGIVPQQSASRLAITWQPILDALSQKLSRDVRFATATDIPTFEACLTAGAYEISYMNPYHYVVFHQTSGYRAIAKQANHRLRGILVARKDSGIKALEDLQGATLAFPSPAAFGASVISRAELQNAGVDFTPRYVRSHDSVYQTVAKELIIAGGGVTRTWNAAADAVKDKLIIFYRTRPYTPHAFALSPQVDSTLGARIGQALYTLDPGLLAPLRMKGIEAATNEDWNDIRALKLERGHTQISISDPSQCRSN